MNFSQAAGWEGRLLIALAAAGIVLRIATLWRGEVLWDGAVYAYMGWSFSQTGEFVLPIASSIFAEDSPLFYRHFPPLYPAYLAAFYALGGFSLEATKVAAIVVSFILLAVAYLTTRDLFGPRKALYALALVALDPVYLAGTWMTYSESLVGILFILTVWAILKSLQRESYILLAGLFAGLGFLTRSHIGYFFAIAGIAGIAWRFYYVRWRFLRDGWYLAAIGLFVGIVGAWSYRNVLRYGWPHWETSWYVSHAYETGLSNPDLFAVALLAKIPLFFAFFAFYGLAFLPELRASMKRIREGAVSVQWIAVALLFLLAWIMASLFWTVEQHTPLWWTQSIRYVTPAALVLLWLVLGQVHLRRPPEQPVGRSPGSFTSRFFALAVVFLAINVGNLAFPAPIPQVTAARELNDYLMPGDVVAVDGLVPEEVLVHLVVEGVRVVWYRPAFGGTYIVSVRGEDFPGFNLVTEIVGPDIFGYPVSCTIWKRA